MATNAIIPTSNLSSQEGAPGVSSSKDFEEEKFMKDLIHLRDSQDAIIGLSGWCIRNRKNNAYKIARCWLKCIKKVKIDQKLTLFHLLNDVVQHSKKRNYEELLDKFQAQIREAMPHLKNTKITQKVIRVLNIWIERQVFEEKYIQELISSIDPRQNRAEQDILDNFQPQQLCTQIKIMKALEDDTDYKLRTVKESELNLMEIDEPSLRQNLKDRQHGNDYINDVEEGRKRLEQYIKAIDRELTKRRQVIEMLTHAGKYYDSLLGEANIVATAYTNFGKRVKNLNRKLEERMEVVKDSHNPTSIRHLSGTSSLDDQDLTSYSSMSIPHNIGDFSTSNIQSMSESNLSSTLTATKSSFNGSKHDSFQNSSGFSISEYLTKLAKGGEPAPQSNYSQPLNPYENESMTPIGGAYLHPPPMPQANTQQTGIQMNPVPQNPPSSETSWWPRQQHSLPPHSTNPPIHSWSSDGDPPPVTSWPPPRPDIWSSGSIEQRSNTWQDSASQDPVPEWQLPIQEDEPPDSDPAVYEKRTSEIYHENSNLSRTPQKSTSGSTSSFRSGTQSRDRKNSSTIPANNLASMTRNSSSMEHHKSIRNPFFVAGSHNQTLSKVVQPSQHSFQSAHLGHADMEMCGDEDDETTKESQLDNLAYNKYDQRPVIGAVGSNPRQSNANIPPLMSEEEFNKWQYGAPNQTALPPPIDNHAATATNSHNGAIPGMGPFSNPPPSLSDSSGHSQFPPMTSALPTRVNPYLSAAPKELTKEEQEEEKRTQSLQDRLRSLAGVPLDNKSDVRQTPESNNTNSFSVSNDQESVSGNAFSYGGRSNSNRGTLGSQYNEYRGGHMGGAPYAGPRAMMRSPMAGSWRGGNPRPGTPMRGGRGMSRGRHGPHW